MAPHGSFFDLQGKAERLRRGLGPANPFVDPEGYRKYLDRSEAAFREKLAKDRERAR